MAFCWERVTAFGEKKKKKLKVKLKQESLPTRKNVKIFSCLHGKKTDSSLILCPKSQSTASQMFCEICKTASLILCTLVWTTQIEIKQVGHQAIGLLARLTTQKKKIIWIPASEQLGKKWRPGLHPWQAKKSF